MDEEILLNEGKRKKDATELPLLADRFTSFDERYHAASQPFDYAEIDRRLGFSEVEIEPVDFTIEEAKQSIAKLFEFLFAQKRATTIGIRALAIAWLVNPNVFGERTAMAVCARFGIKKQYLSNTLRKVRSQLLQGRIITNGNLWKETSRKSFTAKLRAKRHSANE